MMTSAAPPDAPAGSTGSMGRFALSSSSSIHDEAGDSDKQQHAALLKRPVAVSNGLDSRNQHLGADVDDDTMVDVDVSQAADEAVVDDEMDTSDRDDADALVQSDAPTTTTGDTAASFVPDDDDASAGSSGDMRRVKVYLLEDGEWIDRGTGHVGLIPAGDNPCARGHTATLRVERETPPFDTVLETLVYDHSDFQKQDGTLIVWTEADKTDWAVSFAQAGGCGEIWEILQGFCNGIDQDADPLEGLEGGSDTGHSSDDMLDDTPDTPSTVGYHSRSSSVGGSRNGSGVAPLLEEPGTGNVRAIRDTLERIRTRRYPIPAHQLLTFLRTSDYINKLLLVHQSLEDFDATDDLQVMFDIAKALVLLGHRELLLDIVSLPLDAWKRFLGMLEYDDNINQLPYTFRKFFESHAQFRPVLQCLETPSPFSRDPPFAELAHRAYRLAYLKDVAIARFLDDINFAVINDALRAQYTSIQRCIMATSNVPLELGQVLAGEEGDANRSDKEATSPERRHAAMQFLKELVAIAKPGSESHPLLFAFLLNGGHLLRGLSAVLTPPKPGVPDVAADTVRFACEFLASATELRRSAVQDACLEQYRALHHSPIHALTLRLASSTELATNPAVIQAVADALAVLVEPEALPLGGLMSEAGGPTMVPQLTPAYDAFQAMFFSALVPAVPRVIRNVLLRGSIRLAPSVLAPPGAEAGVPIATLPLTEVERVYQLLELWTHMLRINATRFCEIVFLNQAPVIPGGPVLSLDEVTLEVPEHDVTVKLASRSGTALDWIRMLLLCSHKHVQLAAARFVRTACSIASDELVAQLRSARLLEAVCEMVLMTRGRYNLVNSAGLDVLHGAIRAADPAAAPERLLVSSLTVLANTRVIANLAKTLVRRAATELVYCPALLESVGLAVTAGGAVAPTYHQGGHTDYDDSDMMDFGDDNDFHHQHDVDDDDDVTMTSKSRLEMGDVVSSAAASMSNGSTTPNQEPFTTAASMSSSIFGSAPVLPPAPPGTLPPVPPPPPPSSVAANLVSSDLGSLPTSSLGASNFAVFGTTGADVFAMDVSGASAIDKQEKGTAATGVTKRARPPPTRLVRYSSDDDDDDDSHVGNGGVAASGAVRGPGLFGARNSSGGSGVFGGRGHGSSSTAITASSSSLAGKGPKRIAFKQSAPSTNAVAAASVVIAASSATGTTSATSATLWRAAEKPPSSPARQAVAATVADVARALASGTQAAAAATPAGTKTGSEDADTPSSAGH